MSVEIEVGQIEGHPLNSNVMSEGQRVKLRRQIGRSGRYEPLVVRPLPAGGAEGGPTGPTRYQMLNGHHRLEVLRELGHQRVRCEVWEDVDDEEALLLLATLNRLEGRDDPVRRAALLARLAGSEASERLGELSRLVPEDAPSLRRAVELAVRPLPAAASPSQVQPPLRPMTVFLGRDDYETVRRAVSLAGKAAALAGDGATEVAGGVGEGGGSALRRRGAAAGLVRLAESYLGHCAEGK